MTNELATKKCAACAGDARPLDGDELKRLQRQLNNGWNVVNNHHLEKAYQWKDFREALDFTNRVGEIAEQENHHPDIYLAWGQVKIRIWTHKIDGLTESDFILAAKVDAVQQTAAKLVG